MKLAFALLLALPLLWACSDPEQDETSPFFSGTWEQALAEARSSGKDIYIFAVTKWCTPCETTEKHIYPGPKVTDFLHTHFVAMKLDADSGDGRRMAMKYRLDWYPAHLIFNNQGLLVYKAFGGLDAEGIFKVLEEGLQEKTRLSFKGITAC